MLFTGEVGFLLTPLPAKARNARGLPVSTLQETLRKGGFSVELTTAPGERVTASKPSVGYPSNLT